MANFRSGVCDRPARTNSASSWALRMERLSQPSIMSLCTWKSSEATLGARDRSPGSVRENWFWLSFRAV